METIVQKPTIDSRTRRTEFGYYNEVFDEFVVISDTAAEDRTDGLPVTSFAAAAQTLNCSEALLRAIVASHDWLRDAIHDDLKDIWYRIDK